MRTAQVGASLTLGASVRVVLCVLHVYFTHTWSKITASCSSLSLYGFTISGALL